MEKTATKKTGSKAISSEELKVAYIEHILMEGHEPASIFAFAKAHKLTEPQFYKHFNSFKALERDIWSGWMEDTINSLEADEAYRAYSVREKLLAFYFTWLETLKNNRSFVLKKLANVKKHEMNLWFLEDLRNHFKAYVQDLTLEGKDTGEVAERPFSQQYEKAFWLHFLFVLRFWLDDDSREFEKTDAAIEKSVHLAFDLVGKGALDSMIDFGKFLFQNRN